MKTNRWVILTYSLCDGWAPTESLTGDNDVSQISTYASEKEAWDEIKDEIAYMQAAMDEGDREDVDSLEDYQVVPYDPEIHDKQWAEAIGLES